MITALILYLTVIAALFVIAAHAAERALRLLRKSGRGPWVAGMFLMCLAPLAVPYLTRDRATTTAALLTGGDRKEQRPSAAPSADGVSGMIPKNLTVEGDGPLTRFDRPLLVVWIAGSIACALFLIGSGLRLAMTARSWRPALVNGIPVVVSHDTGPALIGAV